MVTAAKKPAVTVEKKTAVKKAAPKAATAKAPVVKPAVKATTKPAVPKVQKAVPAKDVATETKPKKTPAKKATTIYPEHRYHMIATAAYYIAERRGFSGHYEMQDWISAEAEIDAKLKAGD
jgi:hypothetical protein